MQTKTKRITESAMLLAVAIILELLSKMIIPEQTFGGQITIVSMLPVLLISYRHGVKWGFVASFAYAILQMALGAKNVGAAFLPGWFGDEAMIGNAIIMCILDYLLAYSVLALGGLLRERIENNGLALMLGSLVALGARYLCHFLSGYVLFSAWAESYFTQEGFPAWGQQLVDALSPTGLGLVYSAVYNGMYMIPEMVFTALAALLIARVPRIVKKVS